MTSRKRRDARFNSFVRTENPQNLIGLDRSTDNVYKVRVTNESETNADCTFLLLHSSADFFAGLDGARLVERLMCWLQPLHHAIS